jgi:hypothetical protein
MLTIFGFLIVGAVLLALCITEDRVSEKEVRVWINQFHSLEGPLDD